MMKVNMFEKHLECTSIPRHKHKLFVIFDAKHCKCLVATAHQFDQDHFCRIQSIRCAFYICHLHTPQTTSIINNLMLNTWRYMCLCVQIIYLLNLCASLANIYHSPRQTPSTCPCIYARVTCAAQLMLNRFDDWHAFISHMSRHNAVPIRFSVR